MLANEIATLASIAGRNKTIQINRQRFRQEPDSLVFLNAVT